MRDVSWEQIESNEIVKIDKTSKLLLLLGIYYLYLNLSSLEHQLLKICTQHQIFGNKENSLK